jgi:hypothetical protein
MWPHLRSSRAKLSYKPKSPALKGALPRAEITYTILNIEYYKAENSVIDPTIYTKPPSYIHPPIRKSNTFEIISVDKFPDPLAT